MKKLFLILTGAIMALGAAAQTAEEEYAPTIRVNPDASPEELKVKAAHVVPSRNQLQALKDGYIAFIHFGPNTFSRREWGTGKEDPKMFDLKKLDTDQWVKAIPAFGAAGAGRPPAWARTPLS